METMTTSQKMSLAIDFLPINGTDHIEMYVGNALTLSISVSMAMALKCWPYG